MSWLNREGAEYIKRFCFFPILFLAVISVDSGYAAQLGSINPGPDNYYENNTTNGGEYNYGCTANDFNIESITAVHADGSSLNHLICNGNIAEAYIQINFSSTATSRYNLYFLFGIDKNSDGWITLASDPHSIENEEYRVCIGDKIYKVNGTYSVIFGPVRWYCGDPLYLIGPSHEAPQSDCQRNSPIFRWDNQLESNKDLFSEYYFSTGNWPSSKCQCLEAFTIPTFCQACIGGRKTNGCTGEGLAGFPIEVYNTTNNFLAGTNTTNATGYWQVCGLVPGAYNATEVIKSGWENAASQSVILGCLNETDVNFNNTPLLCISGYKRNSCDNQPFSGWKIEVFNKTTGTKMGENITNATGYWQVCNLVPGSYWVNETLKAGWQNANPNQSAILGCQNLTGVNFNNTPLLCISGYKHNACDGQLLSGWMIEVSNKTTGIKMGENTTNATGYWQVCNLAPGNYWVNETLKSGWQNANPNQSAILGCLNATGLNFSNIAPSNFTIVKTATADTAEPGDNVTFIINVTNTGECSLSVVRVVDILPLGLVYVSDNSTPQGVVSGNLVTWSNVGPLGPGAIRFIELIAKVVL